MGTQTLPCSLVAELGCKSLPQSPPSLFVSILRKSFIQKSGLYEGRVGKSHGNETLSRPELLGRGKPATAKGQPTHPLVALPTARQHCCGCRLAPWSLEDGASLSSVSQALQAQVRRKKMANLLEESFKPALLTPGEKRCPGAFSALGLRAGLLWQCHCTAQVPSLQLLPFTFLHPHQDISNLLCSPLQLGINMPCFSD